MTSDQGRIGDYSEETTGLLLGSAADLLRSFGLAFGGRHLAIVGGLVPTLKVPIPPTGVDPHPGTADLDLLLSIHLLDGETAQYYDSIVDGLTQLGMKPAREDGHQRKWRWIGRLNGIRVTVEFLCPLRPHPKSVERPLKGTVAERNIAPDGRITAVPVTWGKLVFDDTEIHERRVRTSEGEVTFPFPVAGITSWLCLKSDAMVNRAKTKDAFDVVWLIAALSPEATAQMVASSPLLSGIHRDEVIIQLRLLVDDRFRDIESVGPVSYALFHHAQGSDEPLTEDSARKRAAFGTMQALGNELKKLSII